MDTITLKSIDLNSSHISATEKSICIEMPEKAEVDDENPDISKLSKNCLEIEYASKFVPTTPERTICNHINSLIWSAYLLFKDFCLLRKKK